MNCDLCGVERDLVHVCMDALKAENAKLRARIEWLEKTNFIRLRADLQEKELQNDELCGLARALHLFVGVYDGKVLDKDAALHLIRKYAKPSGTVGKEIIEYQDERDKFKEDLEQSNRLNEVLQNRMKEIAKVASKPGSQFPKAMAAMNEVEGKIAIVACELSGDLSYIKDLAESPITEKRVCVVLIRGYECGLPLPCPDHNCLPQ